jgi:uncharacterized protein with FMN-binding domain
MRRITLWLLATVTVMVLLFSYRTSLDDGTTPSTVAVGGQATTSGSTPTDTATPGTAPPSSGTTASSGSATYTGAVAQTRWGPVQVAITVTDGKITNVAVPTYPSGNGRDQEINASALPILTRETLSAQSARIDTVSGATVTSDGYIQSLQSALAAAR